MKTLQRLSLNQKISTVIALTIIILTLIITTYQEYKVISDYDDHQSHLLYEKMESTKQKLNEFVAAKITTFQLIKKDLKRIENKEDAELFLSSWMESSQNIFEYSLNKINQDGDPIKQFSLYSIRFSKALNATALKLYQSNSSQYQKILNKAQKQTLSTHFIQGPEEQPRLLLTFLEQKNSKLHVFKFTASHLFFSKQSLNKYLATSNEGQLIASNLNETESRIMQSVFQLQDDILDFPIEGQTYLLHKSKLDSYELQLAIATSFSPIRSSLKTMRVTTWLLAILIFAISLFYIIKIFVPIEAELTTAIHHLNDNEKISTSSSDKKLQALFSLINQKLLTAEEHAHLNQQKIGKLTQQNVNKDVVNQELAQVVNLIFSTMEVGFFIFNREGKVTNLYNRYFQQLIKERPLGLEVKNILFHDDIETWLRSIFKSDVPFEDYLKVAPTCLSVPNGQNYQTQFYPVYDHRNLLDQVICVITDVSDLNQLNRSLEKNTKHNETLKAIQSNRETFLNFIYFLKKFRKTLTAGQFELQPNYNAKYLHYHFVEIQSFLSLFMLDGLELEAKEIKEKFISFEERFDTSSLFAEVDHFLEEVFYLLQSLSPYHGISVLEGHEEHNSVISLAESFQYYEHLFMQLNLSLGKKCSNFELEIPEINVSLLPFRDLFIAMGDLYRDIAIHANQAPEVREAMEKKAGISVKTIITIEENLLKISIMDDGNGINPNAIREVLKRQEADEFTLSKSDEDLLQLIFQDGLTLKNNLEDQTGNGYGLAEIRKAINVLDGRYRVDSEIGKGTTFTFSIPIA